MWNRKSKIGYTLVQIIAFAITLLAFLVYTTEPYLHYFIVIPIGLLLIILAAIGRWIARKTEILKLLPLTLIAVALLTAIPMFLIDSLPEWLLRGGGLFICGIGMLFNILALILAWRDKTSNPPDITDIS